MMVAISRGLLADLLARAAGSPDAEICGLLLGRPDRIEDILPARNVASDPRDRFEVDPRVLFAAHRAERAGGTRVIGHYHSHPHGRAAPSPRDAEAAVGGEYWLIVADGQAALFRAVDSGGIAGRFEGVTLSIDGEPATDRRRHLDPPA